MDIDDIFFAAINGEKEKLIELLEADEVDINQYLLSTVGGEEVSVFLLFSVIAKMAETNFNYEILDILIRYGADVDKPVIVETDVYTRKIPIIVYAIRQFNSFALANYLLQRGANPNNPQTENYNRDYEEYYPPLYFAMMAASIEYTKLLLYYGADPNRRVCAYNHEVASSQFIPLLFYATNNFLFNHAQPLSMINDELSYWLIGYGADIHREVISFIDNRGDKTKYKRYKFYDYLRLEYKGCEIAVNDALKKLNNRRYKAILVSKEAFIKPEKRTQKVRSMFGNNSPQVVNSSKSNNITEGPIPIAEQMIAYYWKNRFDYPYGDKIRNEKLKKKYDDEWNAMGQKLSAFFPNWGAERFRWWEYNAFQNLNVYSSDFMIYGPADRITTIREVVHLESMLRTRETILGKKLEELISDRSNFNIILKEDLDSETEYALGELCFWDIKDGTVSYSYDEALYSEAEIRDEMASYNQELDSNEELRNAIWSNRLYTNEEMFMMNKMDYWDYQILDNIRSNKLYDYEEKLRSQKRTVHELEDINIYNQYFRPVGLIAFDNKSEVVAIALYNQGKIIEYYKVDYEKTIFEIKQLNKKTDVEYVREVVDGKARIKQVVKEHDIKKDRLEVIKNLMYYNIKWRNPFIPKPDYLSNDEWLLFLYVSRYPDKSYCNLKSKIKLKYQETMKEKQKVLNKGKFIW